MILETRKAKRMTVTIEEPKEALLSIRNLRVGYELCSSSVQTAPPADSNRRPQTPRLAIGPAPPPSTAKPRRPSAATAGMNCELVV